VRPGRKMPACMVQERPLRDWSLRRVGANRRLARRMAAVGLNSGADVYFPRTNLHGQWGNGLHWQDACDSQRGNACRIGMRARANWELGSIGVRNRLDKISFMR